MNQPSNVQTTQDDMESHMVEKIMVEERGSPIVWVLKKHIQYEILNKLSTIAGNTMIFNVHKHTVTRR